jgi:hypothetical protein
MPENYVPVNYDPVAPEEWASGILAAKQVLLINGILEQHMRSLIDMALWLITQGDSNPSSPRKHKTRLKSKDAHERWPEVRKVEIIKDGKRSFRCDLVHEHIHQRSKMIEALMLFVGRTDAETQIDETLHKAIPCTVTRDEHQALNKYPHLDGLDRYEAAKITIIDTFTGEVYLDFSEPVK